MDARENLLSLLRRRGYEKVPVEFSLCPEQEAQYREKTHSALPYQEYFRMPWKNIDDRKLPAGDPGRFLGYYPCGLKPGTQIDCWGIAHEPGSAQAKHMTYMRHPLENADSPEAISEYPFPDYENADASFQKQQVAAAHAEGLAALGNMQCTIWETAWYLRSMEELMMDMAGGDPKAELLLEKVTERSILRAASFARAGVDILFLGDDVGMQSTVMMSDELYCAYLKPRLKRVISAAKAIKPDLLVFYHSCGFITPFIPHLIEAGIDVLNPIQAECMDFAEIYRQFGDRLSFHGTLGTQTVMPFGTPDDVRRAVFRNLDLAGEKGGLFVAPTHVLEPEVPWENILAYVRACEDYK